MRKSVRRAIFYCAVAGFLAITLWAVTYATGYTYDFSTRHWLKTGALFVQTNVQAELWINNKFIDTTALINDQLLARHLYPGEYSVALKKSGYQTWQKTVTIKSGEVVAFGDVWLVPNSPEFTPQLSGIAFFNLAPNDQLVLLADSQRLLLFSLASHSVVGNITFLISSLRPDQLAVLWDEKNSAVILHDQQTALRFDFNAQTVQPITLPVSDSITLRGDKIYYLAAGQLRSYNWQTKVNVLMASNVAAYWLNQFGTIVYIDSLKHTLWQLTENDPLPANLTTSKLLVGETVKSLEQYQDTVLLLTSKALYQLANQQLTALANGVGHYVVSPDKTRLAWHTNHEIWQFWLVDNKEQPYHLAGERELLERTSDIVRNLYWQADSRVLISEQLAAGKLIEIDPRGGSNYPIITALDSQSHLWYSPDSDYLYRLAAGNLMEWKLR